MHSSMHEREVKSEVLKIYISRHIIVLTNINLHDMYIQCSNRREGEEVGVYTPIEIFISHEILWLQVTCSMNSDVTKQHACVRSQ